MQYKLHYKRRLPHYQPHRGIIFLTFRLAFDIPRKYLQAYHQYRDQLLAANQSPDPETEVDIRKKLIAFMDDTYMSCSGKISLTDDPDVAAIMTDQIHTLHGCLYSLYAYTIMPNHVHLVIQPLDTGSQPIPLASIMQRLKGASARLINQRLGRSGNLWFPEYYDYWIRTQAELIRIIEYIRNNPVKARLALTPEAWPHTYLNPDLINQA